MKFEYIVLLVAIVLSSFVIGAFISNITTNTDNKSKTTNQSSDVSGRENNIDDSSFEIKEMDDEQRSIYLDDGNVHDVKIVDTDSLDDYIISGGPYEKDTIYHNDLCRFKALVPKGYTVVQQSDRIFCIRDNEKETQVAIIYIAGNFADGIKVWESSYDSVYSITALLTDEYGDTEEKTVKNYGSRNKSDVMVGKYAVKEELGEIWFRNTGEPKNIKLPSCGYYTTLSDGNGLVLIGTSQTQESTEVFALMDVILASITLE